VRKWGAVVAAVLALVPAAAPPANAHIGANIDFFRVATKSVHKYTVQGNFRVSHSIDLHTNDGDDFTTETRCDVKVSARLVKKGRTVSRGVFTYLAAPDNENVQIFYALNRKGLLKPPPQRAKRLVVGHVHVVLSTCAPF
jgi:hypothetical protein